MSQTGGRAALNYIRKRRAEGISDQQIARELRESGWDKETIEDLLRRAESQEAQSEYGPASRSSSGQTRSDSSSQGLLQGLFQGAMIPVGCVIGCGALLLVFVVGPCVFTAAEMSSQTTEYKTKTSQEDVKDTPQQQGGQTNSKANESSGYIDKMDIWFATKDLVKERLKSPKTADFGENGWLIREQGALECVKKTGQKSCVARGWVDAQNAFGATVRIDFDAQWHKKDGGWQCTSLELDQR